MDSPRDTTAWIFVSHASADIRAVRTVRNYLEDKGAAPLLFHLKALTQPEEFWPLIEREIQARNFFVYCESEAAAASGWVARERAAVERARTQQPKRIGSVRVDGRALDTDMLDAFLAKTRIFASYAHVDQERVQPFLDALQAAGFQMPALSLAPGSHWATALRDEIALAAKEGWVLEFLTARSSQSAFVRGEVSMAQELRAKFVPVLLEKIALPPALAALQAFDATVDAANAPTRLAITLLNRN